ncbi:uncharacterized protein [Diadema antillarum]|uniref:uncharacterized protein n=1 Tax=Diadema antillarum TaxID=105358 RepID=UPI003A88A7B7
MERLLLKLLAVFVLAVSATALTTPHGLNYLGVGYDILKGNPEGGDLATGGVDPGLYISHRVFELTYDSGKKSSDGLYDIPDEAIFIHRSSAARSTSKRRSAGPPATWINSPRRYHSPYEQVKESTTESGYVYSSEETVENLGRARLVTELAENQNYPLTQEFVITVCNLPAEYEERAYMNFLSDWGTHIVEQVDLGTRDVKTYRETRSKFVSDIATSHAAEMQVDATYKVTSVSLSGSVDSYLQEAASDEHLGEEFSSFTIGSADLKEPIGYSLMGMNEIMEDFYWSLDSDYVAQGLCVEGWPRAAIRANVFTAMTNYPAYNDVIASRDDPIKVPLAWPKGTYALPGRDINGLENCPSTDHLTFAFGKRFQNTEDSGSNVCSPSLREHMTNRVTSNTIEHPFCVKEVSEIEADTVWEFGKGSYCIYKKGDCPEGFSFSYIKFDDDDTNNGNTRTGTLPDGDFDHNSSFYYCCRKDGDVKQPIVLPVDKPFYLLANTANCQKVLGMNATAEFIAVNTENYDNWDSVSGLHPYPGIVSIGEYNINITYCYYEPAPRVEAKQVETELRYIGDMRYDGRDLAALRLLEALGM